MKGDGVTTLIVTWSQGNSKLTLKTDVCAATLVKSANVTLIVTYTDVSASVASVDCTVSRPVVASMVIPVVDGDVVSEYDRSPQYEKPS